MRATLVPRLIQLARSALANRIACSDSAKLQIAIRITGGIGDVLIAARWIYDIMPLVNDKSSVVIDIYYAAPKNIVFIFRNSDFIRFIYDEVAFGCVRAKYDLAIIINHLGTFGELNRNSERTSKNEALLKILNAYRETTDVYRRFTDERYHPLANSGFTEFARDNGVKRVDILHRQTGVRFRSLALPLALPSDDQISRYKLPKRYMTVHDGWDSQLSLGAGRPTKAYPLSLWRALVQKLKEQFRDIAVVQLGGDTGAEIAGVDLSLKNRADLPTAAKVMQGSLLHLDTDSGLVHLAASLGVRAVVLFGPTDIEYFGYSGNENINSPACSNCWLSAKSWVPSCYLGYPIPRCMPSISQNEIMAAVASILVESGGERDARSISS
jgi:ADP-heptose:LPS heptosyltransferase